MQRHRRAARVRRKLGGVDLDAAMQPIEAEAEQCEIRKFQRPGQPQGQDQRKRLP